MLDEPTNHLDIDAITWLEDFLAAYGGTIVIVTHDRLLVHKLASRIIEIDRGRLLDWPCDYATFLTRKEESLAMEEKQNQLFDKKLSIEEAWLRQGVKARRTRDQGRVNSLLENARPATAAARTARRGKNDPAIGEAFGRLGHRGGGCRLSIPRETN